MYLQKVFQQQINAQIKINSFELQKNVWRKKHCALQKKILKNENITIAPSSDYSLPSTKNMICFVLDFS